MFIKSHTRLEAHVFWLCSQHVLLLGHETAYDGEDASQTVYLRSGPARERRLATTACLVT
jgi:hypothetical protein